MLFAWFQNAAAINHPNVSKILTIAALIPPSTAEVERSFSLMKLISTRLRNRLKQENLSHCMRICKYHKELDESDYQQILKKWLKAADTASKIRRAAKRLPKSLTD